MKSTATFADLAFPKIGSTASRRSRSINFNAFSVGLIGLENLPWESWPFAGFQQFAGTGDVVHYHLTAPVPCNTAYKLRAVLPNGFLVKAGTSALAVGAAAAKAVADPAQDADGATWSVLPQATGCVGGGNQNVRLDFQGLAGFRLGEQTSIVRLIVGSTTSAATGQAPGDGHADERAGRRSRDRAGDPAEHARDRSHRDERRPRLAQPFDDRDGSRHEDPGLHAAAGGHRPRRLPDQAAARNRCSRARSRTARFRTRRSRTARCRTTATR